MAIFSLLLIIASVEFISFVGKSECLCALGRVKFIVFSIGGYLGDRVRGERSLCLGSLVLGLVGIFFRISVISFESCIRL